MAKRRRRRSWYEVEPRDPRLWLYGPVPSGFWDLDENRQRYVQWLGEQLGFTQPEDWYRVTRRHFQRHRGGGLLGRKFHDSPSALLKDVFPYYDWKEWLFVHAPSRFWQQRANRLRYFDWLGQQLGYRRPEEWYRLTQDQLTAHGGARLLKPFGDPLLPLLKDYLPEYEWLEWRFRQVPKGFWDQRANRRRYLDWLGQQLGFKRPEDWYQLSTQQLGRWHGERLRIKFRSSPFAIVKDYLPHYPWLEWRFRQVPQGFWDQRANRRRYLDWLGRQLGFKRTDDWHLLSTQQLRRWYGRSLLKKFRNSRVAFLEEYLPEGDWKEWLFRKSPNGFWRQRANRRRYLDWLGQQLGFKRPEDWAHLRASDVLRHRGKGLLKQFQFRIAPLVREYLGY
jgi:hypothetical protein